MEILVTKKGPNLTCATEQSRVLSWTTALRHEYAIFVNDLKKVDIRICRMYTLHEMWYTKNCLNIYTLHIPTIRGRHDFQCPLYGT